MSERFPDSLLADIRAALPITDLIGQYVSWDKAKSNPGRRDMWANCPLHGESSPSFHAQDEKGTYHCFGCGESGDHFAFMMKSQGMSFPDAVRHVADLAGVSLPGDDRTPATAPQPIQDKPERQERPQASAERGKRETVKTYDYTDRDGNLLYQVRRVQIRMPDGSWARTKDGKGIWKSFMQCRPSGLDDGSWLWGLSEGEYIRPPRGKDWLKWERDRAQKWPDAPVRFFGAGPEHTIYRHAAVEIAIAEGRTVLLNEGEKDAETSVLLGYCGTTTSCGSKHWTPAHAENFRDADVVICLDNDEAGDRADKLATSLRGIARRIRVLDFAEHVPEFVHKGDITDWVEKFGGNAAKLGEILNKLPDWRPPPPKSAFNAAHVAEVEERRKRRRHSWLVQDLIELGGTCSFSGFSEAGKTFVILELSFCVARGLKFFGCDVQQGLVIYQVGEGELGFEKRIEGYFQDRGITDRSAIPFIYLPKKINLFVDDKDTDALIAESKAWVEFYGVKLRLLVIDTWNKATRGANEISGQDNGKILERVERIATELDTTVIVIDHLSAQGKLRGHGSKTGDVANTVTVEKTDRKDRNGRVVRRIVFGKNKDGEGGVSRAFILRQVVTGYDERARAETTCVVDEPDGDEEVLTQKGRLNLNQSVLLRAIKDAADIEGEKPPAELVQVPPGRNVVKWSALMARLRKTWQFTATDPQKRESELARVVGDSGKRLQLAGFIDRDNDRGLIWWTGKDDRPRAEPKSADKPKPLPPDVRAALDDGVMF